MTMKRSDLKVGEAYYYDRSTSWQDYPLGRKAVVVDDKRYRINKAKWGWRHNESPHSEDPKGNAVLVDIHTEHASGLDVDREAVLVAHLRGLWEETRAALDRATTARREAEHREAERTSAQYAAATDARRAAEAIGVNSAPDVTFLDRVTVPTAQFAAMVTALADIGWHHKAEG